MSTKNTGGPAFPIADPFAVKGPGTEEAALRLRDGMHLRDYFAAKAMQEMLASGRSNLDVATGYQADDYGRKAYALADSMLKAREA